MDLFFPYKDKLPLELRSSLAYQYGCQTYSHRYIGSTYRNIYIRVHEHSGKSPVREKGSVVHLIHQFYLDHSIINNIIDILELKILDQISLHILESLYILKEKPKLNGMHSVTPLFFVR